MGGWPIWATWRTSWCGARGRAGTGRARGGGGGVEGGGGGGGGGAVGAYGGGLGGVVEGVGWGVGALVGDLEGAALVEQLEGGVGADAVDAAGGDVAGYAEVADVGLVAHTLKLADGDVVALVVADSGEGEVGDGDEDHHGGGDDLELALAGGDRYNLSFYFTPVSRIRASGHDLDGGV